MKTLYGEKFNNLTGDIQLNPASFGLFMRDIEEASLNLKTAIYNGNVELTADLYKEMEDISKLKYGLMSPNGGLEGNLLGQLYGVDSNGNFLDYNMSGKNPGLYMNHQRLGYWNGTSWNASITNSGQAYFGNDTMSNYLLWDGLNLTIRGDLLLPSGNSVSSELNNLNTAVDNIDRSTLQGVPLMLQVSTAPSGSGLKITNTHLGYYSNGNWKTFMDQTGGFYLNGSGTNYLSWNGNTLTINGELILPSGNNITSELSSIVDNINNIDISWSGLSSKPSVLAEADNLGYTPPFGSYGLKITPTHLGYYSNGNWKTYIQDNGNFYLNGTSGNYLSWNGSTLIVRGDIMATSASFGYIQPGGAANDINTNNTYINGGKIVTGSITANQIQTNTITTSHLNFTPVTPGTGYNSVDSNGKVTSINGSLISVENIDATNITSGTITGRTIQTSDSGQRIVIAQDNKIDFFRENGSWVGCLQGTSVNTNAGTFDVIRALSANLASELAVIAGTGFISGNHTSILAGIRPPSDISYDLGTRSRKYNTIHTKYIYDGDRYILGRDIVETNGYYYANSGFFVASSPGGSPTFHAGYREFYSQNGSFRLLAVS